MLKRGYSPEISAGTICASGTLGQIIPPSIVLVMLGDVMTTAYQQAQLQLGSFSPKTVSVGELFAGALVPGLVLVGLYLLYLLVLARVKPAAMPPDTSAEEDRVSVGRLLLLASGPLLLIVAVLGAIIGAREYSTGMIRTTLAAVPKRLPVLWGKLTTFVVVVAPVALVGVLISFFGGMAILDAGGAATVAWSDEGVARAVAAQLASESDSP